MVRNTRATSSARDQADVELAAIFAGSDNGRLRILAERMARCRQSRAEKSRSRDLRSAVRQGWGYQCKTVTCSACRRAHHVRKWQRKVHARFAGADNELCSHVTVHLARVGDLDGVRGMVQSARRACRDVRDRQARQDCRWRTVEMAGLVEVDAMVTADVPLLLSDRAEMLPNLPLVSTTRSTMWLPHLHAAVYHPGVGRAELQAALESRWDGPHRVDVKPFHDDKPAGENAADVFGYASKFDASTNTHGIEEPWPAPRCAEWWDWLHSLQRGIDALRISLKPMGTRTPRSSAIPHAGTVPVSAFA
jgi:ribosomal protein S12